MRNRPKKRRIDVCVVLVFKLIVAPVLYWLIAILRACFLLKRELKCIRHGDAIAFIFVILIGESVPYFENEHYLHAQREIVVGLYY